MTITGGPDRAHASNESKLHNLEKTLKNQKAHQEALAKKMADAKSDMTGTQNKLVKLASSIRTNEGVLAALDTRIADLSRQNDELTAKLQTDYGSISGLILALERLRRVPPESLIARPGAPLQTAESAMLLEGVLPAVSARATQLSDSLKRLANIRQDLDNDRDKAAKTNTALKGQYADMQTLLKQRKALFISTRSDYRDNARKLAVMAKEADSLRDLMARLAEEDRRQEDASRQHKPAIPMPATGIANLPVSGRIVTAFGGKNPIGAVSQGLRIDTRPGTLVTAPMGGIVKFAGSFRNYGDLIIIEHQGNYHSLIGGLGHISVAVGQSVKAGEPLGTMPLQGASSEANLTLYYELRHQGHPIDPATKLGHLRS
jgi:septal ring factor EnvC (AmiA/AmiB activator)